MGATHTLTIEPGRLNLSPTLFLRDACHYLEYFRNYKPNGFSAVPYFLCCRAIELALKAKHLDAEKTRKVVKDGYSHKLLRSYLDLPEGAKTLSDCEVELQEAVSAIYEKKEFEYLSVMDACTAYNRFPDLESVANLADKILKCIELE